MRSTIQIRPARNRPGGRTAQTTGRIHDAVLSILVSEGVDACTFGRVAAMAGVQRSTLYRRFPDRWAMMLQVYMSMAEQLVRVDPTGDFRRDVRGLLTKFTANFATPIGAAVMRIALSVRGTDAQVHLDRFLAIRIDQFEPIFAAAVRSGQLDADVDRGEILERAGGAAIFRLFIAGRQVDEAWIDGMVADLAKLYCLDGRDQSAGRG